MSTQATMPDYAIVANPFNLPIEEVVAAIYGIPLYDDIYGLYGGITENQSLVRAALYDHGRKSSGFSGRLWLHEYPQELHPVSVIIRRWRSGWLYFNFRHCCNMEGLTAKALIEKALDEIHECLKNIYGAEVPGPNKGVRYSTVNDDYYETSTLVVQPVVVAPDCVESMALESLTWALPAEMPIGDNKVYTVMPLPWNNSPAEIANVLYPLHIEDRFRGFSVGGECRYEPTTHVTRHCTNKVNQNRVSVYLHPERDYSMSYLRRALPVGYNGGYLIIAGRPTEAKETLRRIERLCDHKFPETEWRGARVEDAIVFAPTLTACYNSSKDLYEGV